MDIFFYFVTKELYMKTNFTIEEAFKKLKTKKNCFLSGTAGTGKTWLLNKYIEECQSNGLQVLVCAPTGIASLNLDGITMHAAFSIPIPAYGHYITEITNSKVKAALSADVIIIDEISMCRNDVFEYFGYVIDYIQSQGRKPQIIVSGDFLQLPPVVPEEESKKLKRYGFDASGYCFTSRYWNKMKFVPVVLTEIKRQEDKEFMEQLNLLRLGDKKCLKYFNQHVYEDYKDDEAVYICSTNSAVNEINQAKLNEIDSPAFIYQAVREKHCAKEYTVEENLILKEGAKVMFMVNDVINNKYQNGTIGKICKCYNNAVDVDVNGEIIHLYPYKWTTYNIKTSGTQIAKTPVGSFSQIPLKLAYAVTMHKTQGQTYEKCIINPNSFADGQLYVAISRCKSIDGVIFTKSISESDIKVNQLALAFASSFEYVVPDNQIKKRQQLDKAALDRKKKKKSKSTKSTSVAKKTIKKSSVKKTTKKSSSKKPAKRKVATKKTSTKKRKKSTTTKKKPTS